MKKLSALCFNVEETEENFVGIKYNNGDIKITFPLGYEIPKENEIACRKSVIQLFKTIKLAHEKKLDYENGENFLMCNDGLSIDSYMWILSDYIENGLYSDSEKTYHQNNNGKINWKRTFKTAPFVSHNSLVYLNPIPIPKIL